MIAIKKDDFNVDLAGDQFVDAVSLANDHDGQQASRSNPFHSFLQNSQVPSNQQVSQTDCQSPCMVEWVVE